ncbi:MULTISPECIES: tripartite tricarboxylate transporter substrate binding protein [Rhodopseudomonas]|uniref:ABC transporter substrate-binding protein n=1 Tax=Rhodopseudomonas palustris TaxID=1076 RepID=A0A0D7F5W9_RHOPL|nr:MULTISPECIES: tripartite tricarboxylate transporter substrate binding protein [Rhodopseudomonas]KIZ48160.1 ABC transporter substrate-binding protein [Rhodopseudomonas palustris]MDF3812050.1 tripartite tricarboxylate transporter substrate binding protein [Rhodopseudomonas sp. BAL398]WOK16090.1 tripartite tricarboxylate transporter substrate binding protein [Rhodopseudomonas sp. BAL398]
MKITRRTLLGSMAAAASFGPAYAASSGDGWPDRPVKMISPYGPGGASDISLRILADQFERRLGKKFFVENKPGAGTRIANETVAHADPDGYTFLYAAAPYSTAEALYGKLSYDPHKDLRPVSMVILASIFLIVNAKAPYKTLDEFIAYGKSKPEGLTFASPGAGSRPHLAGELLLKTTGTKGISVQFRGDATAYTELLAGRVDATFSAISAALPHIKAGTLRVLGCASAQRSAVYPEAPTLVEQGQDIVADGWYGFLAPAATPTPIVDKMQAEINHALSDDSVKQKLLAQGLETHYLPGPEFGAFIDDESKKWGKIIEEAGLKQP